MAIDRSFFIGVEGHLKAQRMIKRVDYLERLVATNGKYR
jgi:hypothetical protein